MNTPDTERAIDVQRYHLGLAFKSILASENPEESFVEYISSRDTYWKERVQEIVKKERGTWAKESIGDKALQSLEVALLDNLK